MIYFFREMKTIFRTDFLKTRYIFKQRNFSTTTPSITERNSFRLRYSQAFNWEKNFKTENKYNLDLSI